MKFVKENVFVGGESIGGVIYLISMDYLKVIMDQLGDILVFVVVICLVWLVVS